MVAGLKLGLVNKREQGIIVSLSWVGIPNRNLGHSDSQLKDLKEVSEGCQHGWWDITYEISHQTD